MDQGARGGGAAGEEDAARVERLGGADGLPDEDVDDGGLEGGGDVGDGRPGLLGGAGDSRLEAAEAEVGAASQPGAGQARRPRPGRARPALDGGAAGEAEAEDARRLVERLAGGVVARAADEAVAAAALGEDELAVAAGDGGGGGGRGG